MRWVSLMTSAGESSAEPEIDGSGLSLHRLPYVKTDCSGSFEAVNNSVARAGLKLRLTNPAREKNS
jgi:hypothetical protein